MKSPTLHHGNINESNYCGGYGTYDQVLPRFLSCFVGGEPYQITNRLEIPPLAIYLRRWIGSVTIAVIGLLTLSFTRASARLCATFVFYLSWLYLSRLYSAAIRCYCDYFPFSSSVSLLDNTSTSVFSFRFAASRLMLSRSIKTAGGRAKQIAARP